MKILVVGGAEHVGGAIMELLAGGPKQGDVRAGWRPGRHGRGGGLEQTEQGWHWADALRAGGNGDDASPTAAAGAGQHLDGENALEERRLVEAGPRGRRQRRGRRNGGGRRGVRSSYSSAKGGGRTLEGIALWDGRAAERIMAALLRAGEAMGTATGGRS